MRSGEGVEEDAMTVRELMSGGLITVRRETPVLEARDLMAKERIRHLLVTDPGGALVGIVTDRDIRLNLPSQATSLSVWEISYLLTTLTVGEVMTRSVITVGPDRPAREGARLLLDHQIGALPVLEDGHLIGILTETDIVRSFVQLTAPMPSGRH
jgi:acetoin utilization protein AcuB